MIAAIYNRAHYSLRLDGEWRNFTSAASVRTFLADRQGEGYVIGNGGVWSIADFVAAPLREM